MDLGQGHAAWAMGRVELVTPGRFAQTDQETLDRAGGEDSRIGQEALFQSVLKVKHLLSAMPQLCPRFKPTVCDMSTWAPA